MLLGKTAVWAIGLLPLVLTAVDVATDGLGANPIEALTHRSGFWALSLLVGSLAISPLRRITGWNPVIQLRRPLGLFAFFYASLHLAIYLVLDQGLELGYIGEDILERPYITIGFTAFLLLVPLAVTSTRGMVRRLGGRRWQRLHKLVYLAAPLAVLHFVWLVKADLLRPGIFAVILLLLLLLRFPTLGPAGWRRTRRSNADHADPATSRS